MSSRANRHQLALPRRGVDVLAQTRSEIHFGGKAAGLLSLPRGWSPPFVVLDTAFRELWQSCGSVRTALDIDSALRSRLSELVATVSSPSSDPAHLLVRSNGPGERRHPGEAATEVVRADLDAVEGALEQALRAFVGSLPLLQVAIEPSVLGLMSNERRWTPRHDTWLVEGDFRLRGPEITRVRGKAATDRGRTLGATTTPDVLACLRRVGGLLASRGGEWRVEWLWDAERVWIVQADRLEAPLTDRSASRYLTSRDRRRASGAIAVPEQLATPKLEAWRTFRELGWPTYPLHALTGIEWQRRRETGDLGSWLAHLGTGLTVVRTDIRAKHGRDDLLLPTSSPSCDPQELASFMDDAARGLRAMHVRDADWLFLVSPVVRARASAFAKARPGEEQVELDALWGFPDGLLHLPHDTCVVNGSHQAHYIRRHKPLCLLAEDGGWHVRPVTEPLDWKRVLQKDEAVQIASWARALAERWGKPVVLMALAKVGGGHGAGACLPFFASVIASTPLDPKVDRVNDARSYARISSPDDLAALKSRGRQPTGIDLAPSAAWIRDASFLRNVAEYSAALAVPVAFHGSLLGHASYVLRARGAPLISVAAPGDLTMRGGGGETQESVAVVVCNSDGLARVETFDPDIARAALSRQIEVDENRGPDQIEKCKRNYSVLSRMPNGRSARVAPGKGFERLGMVAAAVLERGLLLRDKPGIAAGFMRPPSTDELNA